MASITLERDVETLIDNELTNLGWSRDPYSGSRNVFQQKAKTLDQQKRLAGRNPDYTLYRSGSDEPIGVIEAKRPGQKIHDALEQGANYANAIGAPIVFATDGIFTKTLHTKALQALVLNGEEVDELLRESLALKYLTTNEVNTLDKKVVKSRGELISIFETVNKILRGEGLQQGLERFTEFANLLFLKVLSETEDAKEQEGLVSKIDRAYRWESFRDLKGDQLLSYVSDTVLKWFANAYQDENIFQPLQIKHPDNLREIISLLDGLQLTDINADVKGDAFEYFIRSYSASNPGDLGEIFTPRHIVKATVKLLNPQIGETIYDPFCGTGGMLTVAFKHLVSTMPHNAQNFKTLQESTIYGADLTKTASIAKMNMILAGDGHNNIKRQDSLANPVDDLYDVVLTNMPFAQTTRYGGLYTIPNNNADIICPQHCFRAVKPGGRIAIIVPEGFLANGTPKAFQDVRHYLLDHCVLKSIVSLPRGAFEPYNRAKANIMLLTDIKQGKTKGHYWYFDIRNDGYTLDKKRRRIAGGNDLDVMLSESQDLEVQPQTYLDSLGIVRIEVDRVRANKYALNAAHYREPVGLEPQYPTLTFEELFEKSGKSKIGDDQEAPIMSITMHRGLIDQDQKFARRIASTNIATYKKVFKGELVIGFPIDEGVLGFQLKYPYAAVSPAYAVWKLKRNDIDPRFLEQVLRSPQMRSVYRIKLQGAVDRRRSIDPDVLLGVRIPIPPVEIRNAIVNRLSVLEDAQSSTTRVSKALTESLGGLWSVDGHKPDPSKNPPDLISAQSRARFEELYAEWRGAIEHQSAVVAIAMHPAYQQIIGMGPQAIPQILEQLGKTPAHWFWALRALTGLNPVEPESEGNLAEMADAWLKWGRTEGYIV